MVKNLLLPHGFKKIGWAILIPTIILGAMMWIDGFNGFPSYLYPSCIKNTDNPVYALLSSGTTTRTLNNISLIGILLGSLFITCSRERIEDEMIERIRLNALLAALYTNLTIIIIAALLLYDLQFLEIMVNNLVTMPLLFLAIFRWQLWQMKKQARNEE